MRWSRLGTRPNRLHFAQPQLLVPPYGVDNQTLLLLHCNGSNGSASFVDSSGYARSLTAVGNAQLQTASKKFGTASALFDGTGDSISVPDSNDWAFGDFTLEAFVNYASVGIGGLFGQNADASNYWVLYRSGGAAALRFTVVSGGSTTIDQTFSWTPTAGVTYHVALTRSGTSLRAFIDGTQIGTTQTVSSSFPNVAAPLLIGDHAQTAGFNGWMDEIRISNIARYTANFTAPTAEF